MRYLYSGFHNTRARDLLARVIVQFPINPFMISENKAWLKEARDASTPFTDIVEHAFEVQEFVLDVGQTVDDG